MGQDSFVSIHAIDLTKMWLCAVGNLLMLCNGLVLGWPICLPLLMSDESPLPTGRITLDEASWMVSIPCFGTIFGSVFFAFLTRSFGRKKPLFVVAVPFIVSSFVWKKQIFWTLPEPMEAHLTEQFLVLCVAVRYIQFFWCLPKTWFTCTWPDFWSVFLAAEFSWYCRCS